MWSQGGEGGRRGKPERRKVVEAALEAFGGSGKNQLLEGEVA